MITPSTNSVVTARFAGAMYNQALNYSTTQQVLASTSTPGAMTDLENQLFIRDFSNMATSDVATIVATNLGLTGEAFDAAVVFLTGWITGTVFTERGAVIAQIVNNFSLMTEDPTFGSFATAWNARVGNAVAYAQNPSSTATIAFPDVPSANLDSFTLTNGTDIATANIFTAGLVYTPGGDDRINALQDEDQLTGTGTNPTLNATLGNANDNGGPVITPTLTGISTINTAFTGSGAAGGAVAGLDLQDATGVAALNVTRIAQTVNIAEVANLQTPAAALSLSNTHSNQGGVVEFSYSGGVLRGDNTGTLALSNVQVGTLNIGQNMNGVATGALAGFPAVPVGIGVGTNGFEHLTLTSSGGAANVVGVMNLPMDTGTAGVLTIAGDSDLRLGNVQNVVNAANPALVEAAGVHVPGTGVAQAGGRIAAIDASAFTGNLTLVLDNILDVGKAETSGVVQNVTVTGGSGNDTFALYDAVQAGDSVNGGNGNDTLIFYSGSSLASVATSVEASEMLADGSIGNIALDYDFLPNAAGMTLRNISSTLPGNPTPPTNLAETPVTFTLTDLTPAQAAAITVRHATTGNNQITNTIAEVAVKANTASDLVGVTIAEGFNVDPRFNFTIDTAVANTTTAPTASASTFESVTITDSDSESNSVELQNFAQHTGTVTLTGGLAGTFLNLDVDTAGADQAPIARFGTSLVINTTAAATGVQQGLYGVSTNGSAIDFATGNIVDVGALTTEVRLGAATIDAAGEAGNVIVRVGTNAASPDGAQRITMGSGDDTVIFDLLNDARAGLTISDTVAGGAGNDTLAIDGNATIVTLGASEWTNVNGFENLRLVGVEDPGLPPAADTRLGDNHYNLTLTDSFISANKGANGLLAIVNDNDSNNDNLALRATLTTPGGSAGEITLGTGLESGVTIDARSLSATTHFSYNGEEGGWLDLNANGLYDAGEEFFGGLGGTADRFIFSDANVNGGNVIDGGAFDNIAATWNGNLDVFEARNTATVTTGDLANVRNVGIIAGTSDQAVDQLLTLQLNDVVVDSMVDSYHTSTTTEQEVLFVRMNDPADVLFVPSFARLDMDVSQTTARSVVDATLDFPGRRDNVKLGFGTAVVNNFDSGAGIGNDTVTLSASKFGIAAGAIGTTVVASGSNIVYGALGSGAITDRVYVVEGAAIAGYGGAAFDIGIYYDADGSAAGAAVLIGVLVDTGAATLSGGGSGLTIVA